MSKQVQKSHNAGIQEGISLAGSQAALGRILGLDQCTVSIYLLGKVLCPLKVAIRLEKKLGVARWKTRPDEFGQG